MDKYIRIKPYFSVVAHTPDFVELRAGVWNHISFTLNDDTSSGNLYKFIKALDGTQSLSEVSKNLNMSRSESEGIIDHLMQLNVIERGASTAFDYYLDMYAPAFKYKQRSHDEIMNSKIYIISNNGLGNEIKADINNKTQLHNVEILNGDNPVFQILESLDQSWLQNAIEFEEILQQFTFLCGSFVILALDHVNPIFAKKFNRITSALNISWIHTAIDGPFIFVGPLFEPNKTACYECFETRITMNLREYTSYQRYKAALVDNKIIKQSENAMNGILNSVMTSHLILEVLNYVLTGNCFTKNKVLSIYLPTMEITFNEFIKVSTCQNCGSIPHRDDHQLYFDVQALLGDVQ